MAGIMGWPYFVGILVVGSVITFNVAIGGMKGITLVQAAQYWMKVFAISIPLFVVMSVVGFYNKPLEVARGEAKQVDSGIGKRLQRFRLLLPNKELRFEVPILRDERGIDTSVVGGSQSKCRKNHSHILRENFGGNRCNL